MNPNPYVPPVAVVAKPPTTVGSKLLSELQIAKDELAQVLGGSVGVSVANSVMTIAVRTVEAVILGALPSPISKLFGGLVDGLATKILNEGETVVDKVLINIAAANPIPGAAAPLTSAGGATASQPTPVPVG